MNNPIKESNYIPSFSFLKHLSFRAGGNPEKALHYWLNRKSDYEKEHEGTILEEAIFMDDQEFDKKYKVVSCTFPGENTVNYKFLLSYAQCEDVYHAKEESGIRLKEETLIKNLENGWGECLGAIRGDYSPITKEEYDRAIKIREKGRNHWMYKDLLRGKFTYQKYIEGEHNWENGSQKYRGFADAVGEDIVIDMKTTTSLNSFYSQGNKQLNHAQLAMYGDAEGAGQMAFFVVETKEPFSMNVFWLDDTEPGMKLSEGREIYKGMLQAFHKINTNDLWHQGDEFYYPTGRQFDWEK